MKEVNKEQIEQAVRQILEAIGEDLRTRKGF